MSRDLTAAENAIADAAKPHLPELNNLGFTIFGTYRLVLERFSKTVLRLRYSERLNSYVVDRPTTCEPSEEKFANVHQAMSCFLQWARKL